MTKLRAVELSVIKFEKVTLLDLRMFFLSIALLPDLESLNLQYLKQATFG